jgi:prophage maintenance system killer protein
MADDLPTPGAIITIHDRIGQKYDLKYTGIRTAAPRSKLRREVIEPDAEYDDRYHRAATLLFGIQSAHVFEDANKRTAWTATMEYLDRTGSRPDLQQDDDTIERIVRRAGLFDVNELAAWLETDDIDESKLPEH